MQLVETVARRSQHELHQDARQKKILERERWKDEAEKKIKLKGNGVGTNCVSKIRWRG
jgi:hypothetical protein